MNRKLLIATVALAAAVWLPHSQVRGQMEQGQSDTRNEEMSPEVCAACHEDQVASMRSGPHIALDRDGLVDQAGVDWSCLACHGDAADHLEAGGGEGTMFAFGPGESPQVKSQVCLTCHNDVHPGFAASPHAMAGLDCSSCHTVHGEQADRWKLLKSGGPHLRIGDNLGAASQACAECHGPVLAEFEFNETHRLKEGILDCTSCHDPHAAQNRAMLGGFKQEACIDCHTDKGGPFVFEHGSVRAEGCVSCHTPHGSPNRHMLLFQNVAELCFSCHATVPGFHARFTLETQCTNCHSTIHGSNFDPFFLK
jgi:DmsE family decaheme c-type cytochrome